MSAQHKLIYEEEWEKYKQQNALGCILVLIGFPALLILMNYVPSEVSKFLGTYGAYIFIPLILIGGYYQNRNYFRCPRCKKNFRHIGGGYYWGDPADRCVNCNLPLYYSSSRFYDHWGTERGDTLMKEIEAQGAACSNENPYQRG